MRFVNGRLFDDCNKGSFIFASRNGTSTIDHLLARECHFTPNTDFAVLNFNQWSDHAPMHFAVKCNINLLSKHEYVETKYRWNADLKDDFYNGLLSITEQLDNVTSSIDSTCINDVVDQFSGLLNDVAEPLFAKSFTNRNKLFCTVVSC